MSNFAKRLAGIREVRTKIADGNNNPQEFINKMAEWGVTDLNQNDPKPKTKSEAWTSIILLVKSPVGQGWVEGTLMAINDKQEAITALIDKLREINQEFSGYGNFFARVSEDKLKQYEMVVLPNLNYKGMTGGQQVGTWLYGAANAFYGNGVISELENEELEKMAQQLTAEFGLKVRAMLASLNK